MFPVLPSKNVEFRPKQSQRSLVAIFASVLIPALTAIILIARHRFIFSIFVPFAGRFLSSDGIIQEKTAYHFENVILESSLILFGLSCLVPLYIAVGAYVQSRLSTSIASPTERSEIPPVSKWEWLLLFAALILAAGIQLPHITRGLFDDEIFSAIHFIEVPSFLKTLNPSNGLRNHIGYSLITRVCYLIFGSSEWVFRLPSFLMAMGTVYSVWYFGRRWFDRVVGIGAAFYLAALPIHTFYAISARGYAGMAFFCFLSSYYFLEVLKGRWSNALFSQVAFIVTSVLGIYCHMTGGFTAIIQFLFVIGISLREIYSNSSCRNMDRERFKRIWISFGIIAVSTVVLYGAMFLKLLYTFKSHGRQEFSLDFPRYALARLFGPFPFPLITCFFIILGLFVFYKKRREDAVYFALLLIVPYLTLWILSPADLVARFFFFIIPYTVLLAVAGVVFLANIIQRRVRFPMMVRGLFLSTSLIAIIFLGNQSWRSFPGSGYREIAYFMNLRLAPSTLLATTGVCPECFQYYSKNPVRILKTKQEFDQVSANYREIRCAYIFTGWISTDKKLLEFLVQNASKKRFRRAVLFTLKK